VGQASGRLKSYASELTRIKSIKNRLSYQFTSALAHRGPETIS
jgi:hypothetical protein